jgi:hypothetical protein
MAKIVTIGDRTFSTKKAALEEIRAVRDRYPDGLRLNHNDYLFIRDLLSLHTEAEEKIGAGVSHFTVATETEFGGRNRHFVLHRHDGTFTDFSFGHCLNPGSKDRNDRLLALRQAIKEQTWAFRDREFSSGKQIVCPFENLILTPDTCQIDHEAPWTFDALVNAWLAAQGNAIQAVQITPPADNQLVGQMTDTAQIVSWRSFHLSNARLRLLSIRGNLSGARRGEKLEVDSAPTWPS